MTALGTVWGAAAVYNGPVINGLRRRVSSVVEHLSANPKVPGSIPGPVSYRGHGL